jgi:hypothetical protein
MPACLDATHFELRYRSFSPHRCGYAFPCDVNGRVNVDQLSEEVRENYLYARAMVGFDLQQPQVFPVVHGVRERGKARACAGGSRTYERAT